MLWRDQEADPDPDLTIPDLDPDLAAAAEDLDLDLDPDPDRTILTERGLSCHTKDKRYAPCFFKNYSFEKYSYFFNKDKGFHLIN